MTDLSSFRSQSHRDYEVDQREIIFRTLGLMFPVSVPLDIHNECVQKYDNPGPLK
jgi:hypothetical protein